MRTMLDLTVDAVAGCPLADKPDDPCDLSSPAIERHWSDTFHGRCKLDQRDIVGRSKKRMDPGRVAGCQRLLRSEEHTSELQSLMRISYAVFCLKKKTLKTCSSILDHTPTPTLPNTTSH